MEDSNLYSDPKLIYIFLLLSVRYRSITDTLKKRENTRTRTRITDTQKSASSIAMAYSSVMSVKRDYHTFLREKEK